MLRALAVLVLAILLSGCETTGNYSAPVGELGYEPIPHDGYYKVQTGDSLYSVAYRYGIDYRELVAHNHLKRPYYLRTGQKLVLRERPHSHHHLVRHNVPVEYHEMSHVAVGTPTKITSTRFRTAGTKSSGIKTANLKTTTSHLAHKNTVSTAKGFWRWPANGPVISAFSERNRGVNIAGRLGDPIYAAASGEVVYAGDGLRRYGHLIIIKHNDSYLTAYAHNRALLVKEGAHVVAGQKIAVMGKTGTSRIQLHFEIRRDGKSVNPITFLPSRV